MNPERGTFDFTFPDGRVLEFRWRARQVRELESLLQQREGKPVSHKRFLLRNLDWQLDDLAMLMLSGFSHADPQLTLSSFDDWPQAKLQEFEYTFAQFTKASRPAELQKKSDFVTDAAAKLLELESLAMRMEERMKTLVPSGES